MTIIYCDLCGKPLEIGNAGVRVLVSEFKADSCDPCAKRLIAFLKPGPWKSGGVPKPDATAADDCPKKVR